MKNAQEIYRQIADIVNRDAAAQRKITLEELRCDKTIFMTVEDMIYHFYAVLDQQIERERESILRAVSEVLADALRDKEEG